MNIGKTIAFGNTSKVWKTRYSFIPTRYAYLDKKMVSCKERTGSEENVLVWKHDDSASEINNFYGEQFKSALHTSFNKDLSANKLYKSLSLEGTENVKGGSSRFLANSTSQPSQLRDAAVGKLKEKGGILYADLGRGAKNSNSNVNVVGVLKSASRLFSSEDDPDIYGYSYDPSLVKLKIDFLSGNFVSSSEFKILIASDSPGNTTLAEQMGSLSNTSFDSVEANFVSAGEGSKFGGYLIVKDDNFFASQDSLLGDVDADGDVDVQDLLALLTNFGDVGGNLEGDFNNDDSVQIADLLALLQGFGTSTTLGNDGFLSALNTIISQAQAQGKTILAFILTPNNINGRDPKGQYADLFLNLGATGREDFELDILNLNYEPTRLDHSS